MSSVVCDSSEEEDVLQVEKTIIVELYSLKNPNTTQHLNHTNLSSIADSHFNASLPTRLCIHGWQSRGEFKKHAIEGNCVCSNCIYFTKKKSPAQKIDDE